MSYRLSLTLKSDGPAGRLDDTITLVTSSREHPFLEVQAHTKLNERVHTFPDSIDFGTISIDYLKAHPERAWMRGLLRDMPSQPWTHFASGMRVLAKGN